MDAGRLPALPSGGQDMAIGPIEAVRVFVTDLAAARTFYADVLGLGVIDDDAQVLILDTGQARLIVERGEPDDPETSGLVGRFAAVSFAVADAHTECQSLSARGVRIVGWPEQQAWGGILAHIADSDGNVLTLVQH